MLRRLRSPASTFQPVDFVAVVVEDDQFACEVGHGAHVIGNECQPIAYGGYGTASGIDHTVVIVDALDACVGIVDQERRTLRRSAEDPWSAPSRRRR